MAPGAWVLAGIIVTAIALFIFIVWWSGRGLGPHGED
jgi:hypothetical protein